LSKFPRKDVVIILIGHGDSLGYLPVRQDIHKLRIATQDGRTVLEEIMRAPVQPMAFNGRKRRHKDVKND